ncbi:hypothetical protein AAU61_07130 [Desulfocarbo indianensis]|nr:hypothetical protein AAU61_07130 [Desulfocarbo indianensis]
MDGSAPSFSKFRQPFLPKVLVRGRLLRRLAENDHKNLWLVNGQAAQGKTTLLATWASRVRNATVWVNCGPEDSPAENLFWSLLRALSLTLGRDLDHVAAEAGLGRAPLMDPAQLAYLARLIYENAPEGAQLILDNLDQIPSDAASLGLVRALIEVLPPRRRLIILSRNELPGQADLVMQQRAFVLGNDELACSVQEASQLLELMSGAEPPEKQVRDAHRLTEGWIGGLVLYSEYLQSLPPNAAGKLAPGAMPDKVVGGVYLFFWQNIFNQQSRRIQEFLARCAVFSVLDPAALAEAAGEPDAQEILENLRQRHLFISAVFDKDRGRIYRLHQIFRYFLKERYQRLFSPEESRSFLVRAGGVFAAHGYWEEALRCHLGGGEHSAAAETIKRLAPTLLNEGRLGELEHWLGKLPEGLMGDDPWLLYYQCQAWRWIGVAKIIKALPDLRAAFAKSNDKRGALAAQALELDASFAAGLPWSQLETSLAATERLLDGVELEGHEAERAVLLSQYGFIHAVRGFPRKAAWACEQASILIPRLKNPFLASRVLLYHMDALNFMGELERSARKKLEMEALLGQLRISHLPAEAFIPRCYLETLQGNLAQARRELDRAQEMIDQAGLIYMLPIRLLYDCLWSAMAGQHERAQACFAQLHSLPAGLAPPFALSASKVILAMSLSRAEKEREAWDLAHQACGELASDQCKAPSHWASGKTLIAILGRSLGEDGASLEREAGQVRQVFMEIGSRQFQTEAELALCLLAWDRGDRQEALAWLRESLAVRRGKPYEGFFIFMRPREIAELFALSAELGWEDGVESLGQGLLALSDEHLPAQLKSLTGHPLPAVREQALDLKRSAQRRQAPLARIAAFGPLRVRVGDRSIGNRQWGRKQVRQLLMALIALGSQGVSRDKIMDAIWPEANPESAEKTFKVTLHRLRKVFEPNLDRASGSSYVIQEDGLFKLDPELCGVDVNEFRSLAKEAKRLEDAGDPEGAAQKRERAAGLYEGDFLATEAYLPWCREPRRRLREEYLDLMAQIAQFHERKGQIGQAMRFFNRLIETDPYNEYAYQRLMSLQAEVGLLGEAKRTYRACREHLKKGLDSEPGWNTQALYKQILEQSKLD